MQWLVAIDATGEFWTLLTRGSRRQTSITDGWLTVRLGGMRISSPVPVVAGFR